MSCCRPSRQACSWGESTSTPSTSNTAPLKPLAMSLLSPVGALGLAGQLARLLLYLPDQLVEGVGELLDPFLFEDVGDLLVVDARSFEVLEELAGLVHAFLDRLPDLRVVHHVLDGRLGHRVDRVGTDEVLDVHDVRVVRVLGRGRRPQGPLHGGALGDQKIPLGAREYLLELLVDELSVVYGEAAFEVFAPDLIETVIRLRVDAGDEEAGDARDRGGVPTRGHEALEAPDVSARDGPVALEGEDQGDVDGDTLRDHILYGREARQRRRYLDEEVWPVHHLDEPLGLFHGGQGVVGEAG